MGKKDDRKFEIDLYSIISDVLHGWYLIVIAALIGGMAMFIGASVANEVTYSSSATFIVSTSSSSGVTYSSLSTATSLADVLSALFTSDALKERVAEEMEIEEFPGSIEASIVSETNLLIVRVVSDTPENAYQALTTVLDVYPEFSDYLISNAFLLELEGPSTPTSSQNSISISTYTKYGFIVGAAAMLVIIIFLSIITDTLKTEAFVEKKLETKLFGTVYHEAKNKTFLSKLRETNKSLLITNAVMSFYFKETFNKMAVKLSGIANAKNMKCILVTSVDENEGKSTIAANIALALAQSGNDVLLVDADLRKPAFHKMFSENNSGMKDYALFLEDKVAFKDALVYDEKNEIYLLYNKKGYSNASELVASDAMKSMISSCAEKVDFVIIDSPPVAVVSDTRKLSEIADGVLIVARQNFTFTVNINDAIDELNESGDRVIGCIFNDVRSFRRSGGAYGSGYYGYYGKYSKYDKYSNQQDK